MTCINLLPWREMQRKERRRQFASVAFGAVVLMGAIVLYVHMHMDGLIDHQQGRNAFLQKQIKQVDAQIKEIKDLESAPDGSDSENILKELEQKFQKHFATIRNQ